MRQLKVVVLSILFIGFFLSPSYSKDDGLRRISLYEAINSHTAFLWKAVNNEWTIQLRKTRKDVGDVARLFLYSPLFSRNKTLLEHMFFLYIPYDSSHSEFEQLRLNFNKDQVKAVVSAFIIFVAARHVSLVGRRGFEETSARTITESFEHLGKESTFIYIRPQYRNTEAFQVIMDLALGYKEKQSYSECLEDALSITINYGNKRVVLFGNLSIKSILWETIRVSFPIDEKPFRWTDDNSIIGDRLENLFRVVIFQPYFKDLCSIFPQIEYKLVYTQVKENDIGWLQTDFYSDNPTVGNANAMLNYGGIGLLDKALMMLVNDD